MTTAAATVTKKALATIGCLSTTYAVYKAKYDPPHLVWDLDHTILCSVSPHPDTDPTNTTTQNTRLPTDPTLYFDQIDDDFEYQPGVPNTRTYWRPGARTLLRICGWFSIQHVCTAAQRTYTANVLRELDPDGRIFDTIVHRDSDTDIVRRGKDLEVVVGGDKLDRALLFDDRVGNFGPQAGRNGIHVMPYIEVRGNDTNEAKEMMRLVGISVLALMATDVRTVARWFRSDEHKERFDDKGRGNS